MPSKISIPKLRLKLADNDPEGIKKFKEHKIANKSSGIPAGSQKEILIGENGTPNPGIAGPDGTEGLGNEIGPQPAGNPPPPPPEGEGVNLGEHGITLSSSILYS